jgi:apolipoprotein N-acyltransferase
LPVAFVIGAASAFAFEPVGLWPLMPLAFALLCELLARTGTLKRALLVGWLFGLGQFVIGLNWIATAFTYQAAMPAWLGWIAVVLLSLYLAVYPMLAAGLGWTFGRGRPIALVLGLAGAWAITEWLRAGMFTGFAWNPVGVILADTPWLRVSTFLGTYGLSMLVVLAGGALWFLVRQRWWGAFGTAAALGLVLAFPAPFVPDDCCLRTFDAEGRQTAGPIPASPPPPGTSNPPLQEPAPPLPQEPRPPPRLSAAEQQKYLLEHRIWYQARIVQPNIGQQDKWRPGYSEIAAQRLARLSMQPGVESPRLLLWPEAAVTNPLHDERSGPYAAYAQFERARAASLVRPGELLLTGGIALFSNDGVNVTGAANSIFVLGHGGRVLARYDKAHLVPYGEYLPMRPLLSSIGLSRLAPGDVDFLPGPGPQTATLPGWGKVGFQLCYEIIFSGEVVDRRNRPNFIFNPSNDAWFGAWGPPQHLAQARLRAAEEGLPVIRATPTGISAVVDARGRVVKSLPWRAAGIIDTDLPIEAAEPTLFARLGNIIPLALAFAMLFAAIALSRRRRYRTVT